MSEPDPTQTGANDPGPSGQPTSTATPRTLTQEDLNRVATREKQEGLKAGRAKAEAELAEKLGMSIEDASQIIEHAKAKEDAEKSEAQKAREAADKARAEAESVKAQAQGQLYQARVERQLLKAGMHPDKIGRFARLVDADQAADDEAVTAAVTSLKEESPEIFGEPLAPSKPSTPSGDPQGSPPKPQLRQDAFTKGQERAKAFASAP